MFTLCDTYAEACSLIAGFNAGSGGDLLAGFQPWLLERTGNRRPELAWPSLVFEYAFPDENADKRVRSIEQNSAATEALFTLLDEFLASNDADPPASG